MSKSPTNSDPLRPSRKRAPAILIAEDDEMVLSVIKTGLKMLGYRVISTADGSRALEMFKTNQTSIELAILDVELPGMNGYKLAKEILSLKRGLNTIITSAYSKNEMPGRSGPLVTSGKNHAFLRKPFPLDQLFTLVSSMLNH